MYEWIKASSRLEYIANVERMNFDREHSRLEKVGAEEPPSGVTALAQFFMVGGIWLTDNFRIGIPVKDEEVRKLVLKEVAPHFSDVKLSVLKGEVQYIYMQHIKPESKPLFASAETGALPVLEDVYRHRDTSVWYHEGGRKLLYYTVQSDSLQPYTIDEPSLQTVLRKAYREDDEQFGLMPLGWTFDNSLRDSVALRFLAGYAPFITLTVDADTDQVLMLRLSEEECGHPLTLNSARPKPPRRHKNHLYLDVGRCIVYAINLKGQDPVTSFAEINEMTTYRLAEHQSFAEFDHEYGERVPEGRSFLFDQESIQSMIETINREVEAMRGG